MFYVHIELVTIQSFRHSQKRAFNRQRLSFSFHFPLDETYKSVQEQLIRHKSQEVIKIFFIHQTKPNVIYFVTLFGTLSITLAFVISVYSLSVYSSWEHLLKPLIAFINHLLYLESLVAISNHLLLRPLVALSNHLLQ